MVIIENISVEQKLETESYNGASMTCCMDSLVQCSILWQISTREQRLIVHTLV